MSDASIPWPAVTSNGQARQKTLAADRGEVQPTSLISYASSGHTLIIGESDTVVVAASKLGSVLSCSLLLAPGASTTDFSGTVYHAQVQSISGHLGHFKVLVEQDGENTDLGALSRPGQPFFDLVLDLRDKPAIDSEVLPPGYYAPKAEVLNDAIEEMQTLVGGFEKPKYFVYDPQICAHGRSGLSGCTRCIDACPTKAISSLADTIEVDPYLCQGAGSCSTACPTGAIVYAYPRAKDTLRHIKTMLASYRAAGGANPVLLLHDSEHGAEQVASLAGNIPENILPLMLEEIGSVGMDTWLAALSYGASGVLLLCPDHVPASVSHEMEHQVSIGRTLLQSMDYDENRIQIIKNSFAQKLSNNGLNETGIGAAGFAGMDEKRTTLRLATDHLFAQGNEKPEIVSLPDGAPFGRIMVDKQACTLCMACVSVCPAGALEAGGESPRLGFIEWNCVQCGICESACPEDAITREQRFLFDNDQRMRSRTLNEDQPFQCIKCGKEFATQSVMDKMQSKLKDHWMYQKPDALNRLKMCEDCRIEDMFQAEGGLTDSHRTIQ
ncbi:MAG: 4Fe-4S binding protein [Gammaproteobacteria bacterium]|nr:4Fe-4S binding protein [Gammaproteobacteria bacterium]